MKFLFKDNNNNDSTLDFSEDLSLIDLSLDQLIESDFHIGAKFTHLDKLNFTYIFSKRFNFSVINLSYSLYNLKLSVYFISIIVSRRGKILFYDGVEYTRNFVRFIGLTSKQYFIGRKWIAGLLTNFKEFYPAVFTGASRHFRFPISDFYGMRYIHRPPNVFCSLNIERGRAAFLENFRLGIPIVALVNSNNSISGVTFPVFSNNFSPNTYITFFSILRSAVLNGYKYEVYKFYRRSLKYIIRVRYNRHIASRQMRFTLLTYQFRMFILRLLFDHYIVIYNFLKFFLYPILPDPRILHISKEEDLKFAEFYRAFSFLRPVLLNFFNEFLSPVMNSFFFSDLKYSKEKKSFIFPFPPKYQFINIFHFAFGSEKKFYNFFFDFLEKLGAAFFSSDFFFFVDMFFARFLPLVFFLFKSFLRLNKSVESKHFRDLFITGKLIFLCFSIFSLWRITQAAKLIGRNASIIFFHFVHHFFPFFQYQKMEFPNLRSSTFTKILTFKLSRVPFFTGFNHCSFYKLAKSVYDFKKNYGMFSYLRFSRKFKRRSRKFFRAHKFMRFLMKYVHQDFIPTMLYFDLVSSSLVKFPRTFVQMNFFKRSFQARYIYIQDVSNSIKSYNHINFHLVKEYSEVLKKHNGFMLAYFDEEYDDSRFPFNDDLFHFQVRWGSAYLARQHQRNLQLELKKKQLSEGYKFSKEESYNFRFKKRFKLSRIRIYFSLTSFLKSY